MVVLTQYGLRQLIFSRVTNDYEFIMTWILVLVKADFKLMHTMSGYLEHVANMCEQLQRNMLGTSITR